MRRCIASTGCSRRSRVARHASTLEVFQVVVNASRFAITLVAIRSASGLPVLANPPRSALACGASHVSANASAAPSLQLGSAVPRAASATATAAPPRTTTAPAPNTILRRRARGSLARAARSSVIDGQRASGASASPRTRAARSQRGTFVAEGGSRNAPVLINGRSP